MYDDTWFKEEYKTDIKPAGYYLKNISVLKEINYTILRCSLGITDTHTYIPP